MNNEELLKRLELRLRADLIDLSDDEYEAYLETMTMGGSDVVIDDFNKRTKSSRVIYKTISIRGKTRRIPVTVDVTQRVPDTHQSEDGSVAIMRALGFDPSLDILSALESSDSAFSVLLGLYEVNDIIECEDKWGVITSIDLDNSNFTMTSLCDKITEATHDLLTISNAYRCIL
jgi:DNA-directed RNA polymerase beta subunit